MASNELLQPYRGTKDYYPEDYQRLDYIFAVWREACMAFGYEEYLSPLVESRELYTQKEASGDEIANKQLYWFTDQGGREIAIRPEMTPSVSRMVGARYQQLQKPIRWFSIANFMRYERPQKGRVREFFQLNIDSFGDASTLTDVELIEVAIYMMQMFGATSEMFEIRLNNRKWFSYWLEHVVGVKENEQQVSRIIDNLAKNTPEENVEKLGDVGLTPQQIDLVLKLPQQDITELERYVEKSEGAKELYTLLKTLEEKGYAAFVRYDASLVRGFDYYTGNVFEQFDLHPDNNRSMFGGGRYDDLVELYSGISVPANGFAPGNVTTELFLDNWKLWPEFENNTDVLVTVFGEEFAKQSGEVAKMLRDAGLFVELYLKTGDSIKDQLAYANKKGVPFVVILGPEELEKGLIIWKNMTSGEQQLLKPEDLLELIGAHDGEHE